MVGRFKMEDEKKDGFDFLPSNKKSALPKKKRIGKIVGISKGLLIVDVDGNGEQVDASKYEGLKIGDTIEL